MQQGSAAGSGGTVVGLSGGLAPFSDCWPGILGAGTNQATVLLELQEVCDVSVDAGHGELRFSRSMPAPAEALHRLASSACSAKDPERPQPMGCQDISKLSSFTYILTLQEPP